MLTKKLMNAPERFVDEMLDGLLAAHPQHVRRLAAHARAIVACGAPAAGKVGVVMGGGSGHEPAFAGYVGRGLADAAAVGDVFTSPPPDLVLACARAVSAGAGVMFLYGNYSGDVMNFDMAAELAAAEGIAVRSLAVTDDVAAAPRERAAARRGVAGDFFVFKIAGAAADLRWPLDDVARVAGKANDRTRTMGVALGPCSLPQTRMPGFTLGPEEMEIGLGIHGEPGIRRGRLRPADEVVDAIMDAILAELGDAGADPAAVLVNGLGATPLSELYVLNRRVRQRLDALGIAVHATWVGNYCTSLEMAGASVTLIRLDAELIGLLDHPASCPALRVG